MKRNLLILAGLVLLLWGAWYLYHAEEKSQLSVRERRDFFKADSLTVDSIAVRYGTWTHLARRDGRWLVLFPDWHVDAAPNTLRDVFKFTNEMVLENLISTRAEKHRSFKVDSISGSIFQFFSGGIPTAEFVLGKAGADLNHTYIRQLQSDSVYMARGDFQRVFKRVPTDWGTHLLFQVDSSELASVRWISQDGEVRVSRAGGGDWLLYKDGGTMGLPVDTSVFNRKLRFLCPLAMDTYAPVNTNAVAETNNPHLQLILDTRDGRSDTLLWNHPSDTEAVVYAFRPGRPKPLFIFHTNSYDRLKGVFRDLVAKGTVRRDDESSLP